jgi:hypothetical protein
MSSVNKEMPITLINDEENEGVHYVRLESKFTAAVLIFVFACGIFVGLAATHLLK